MAFKFGKRELSDFSFLDTIHFRLFKVDNYVVKHNFSLKKKNTKKKNFNYNLTIP